MALWGSQNPFDDSHRTKEWWDAVGRCYGVSGEEAKARGLIQSLAVPAKIEPATPAQEPEK